MKTSHAASRVAALAVAGLLFAFFRFTSTGVAIRACADNLTGAAVVGLLALMRTSRGGR